jgi:hypothetical protein
MIEGPRVCKPAPGAIFYTRPVCALMLEKDNEWTVTRRYMTLEIVYAICENTTMGQIRTTEGLWLA